MSAVEGGLNRNQAELAEALGLTSVTKEYDRRAAAAAQD